MQRIRFTVQSQHAESLGLDGDLYAVRTEATEFDSNASVVCHSIERRTGLVAAGCRLDSIRVDHASSLYEVTLGRPLRGEGNCITCDHRLWVTVYAPEKKE